MAGYTRQAAADIVTNAVIKAATFNAEFNAIQTAFDNSSGHTHDGSASGVGPVLSLANATTGTLAVGRGGTGQTSYTNGQLLIGNTTGNTLALGTLTAGTGVTITNSTGSITIAVTASTYQPLNAQLTTFAGYNTNGLFTQTAAGTYTGRTITAGSAAITVTNGSGVSGNPTVDVGTVPVTKGGTGLATVINHAVLLGAGTSNISTVSGLGTAGYILTSNGASADPTWQIPIGINEQVISSSGNFNVPAGITAIFGQCWAGGGGGGGANSTNFGGGGAGGGYSEGWITVTPAQVIAITIGAAGVAGDNTGTNGTNGGSSSIGASISATGGQGGSGNIAGGGPSVASGGNGSGGQLNIAGANGGYPLAAASANVVPGFGGSTHSSSGGIAAASQTGQAGVYPGSGGGAGGNTQPGGAGQPGLVILRW